MLKKIFIIIALFTVEASAQPPQILKAEAQLKANQLFDIAVTVKHPDSGWDHYANEWIIIADGEKELAKRTLYHPHVNEQPFTRYSRDVLVPVEAKRVTIHAKCNHGHESSAYLLLNRKTQVKQEQKEK